MFQRLLNVLFLASIALLVSPAVSGGDETDGSTVKFSGKGQQATARFKLQPGLSKWQVTHDGRSNFQVSILSLDGKIQEMNINEIGKYNGTQAFPIKRGGEYLLNVTADGKWSIAIDQPKPNNPAGKPLEFRGTGPNVSRFVTLPKGISVFTINHKGDSSFRVKILTSEGKYVEQVVGVIGAYSGSKAITLEEDGVYLLNVSGNGEWSVKVD